MTAATTETATWAVVNAWSAARRRPSRIAGGRSAAVALAPPTVFAAASATADGNASVGPARAGPRSGSGAHRHDGTRAVGTRAGRRTDRARPSATTRSHSGADRRARGRDRRPRLGIASTSADRSHRPVRRGGRPRVRHAHRHRPPTPPTSPTELTDPTELTEMPWIRPRHHTSGRPRHGRKGLAGPVACPPGG